MMFSCPLWSAAAAATLILLPLGLALDLPAYALIGSGLAVNGYFFIRWQGSVTAALV
ncbi:hypothetical protein KCP73_13855 [Salmonella enterica subsp. enterica]|nr:hypothetical protein KCP73_13855 [Salmonella enterica subsp. enterica]